ncbi:MAG: RNA methyltransferase [Chitinophagaceae bacterium]|nr:RNA methyltransferase [Chitinophagaceae bacterium]
MLVKSKAKYIQSLGQKKFRQQEGVFIAEGPKLVNELLTEHSGSVLEVFAIKNWIEANGRLATNCDLTEITEGELEKISQLTTPNQVLAIIKQSTPIKPVAEKEKFILVLDGIQDPGNLGTIIRIADWFGVQHIVCSEDSADSYNPKVVQSTMGSIGRVNVFYTSLTKWLGEQQDARIYAAVLEGQDITRMQQPGGGLIVIGNESKGISEEVLRFCNVSITIPQKGKAESLNAAVATGIILSHFCI